MSATLPDYEQAGELKIGQVDIANLRIRHLDVDKLTERADVADDLGKKYGGWLPLAQKYGKRTESDAWIGLPLVRP